MTVATRYLGTCPVCYREQKLRAGLMVLHGYTRPGYGYVQGNCFGVGWAPFEVSPDGTIAYVERVLQPMLERQELFLQNLRNGTITVLHVPDYSKPPSRFGRETKKITPADGHAFRSEVLSRISSTESLIRQLTRDIAERTEKVRGWKAAPIRTEEETLRSRERVTAEKRAALDEARAARQAKREALDAKQRAREQERADLISEYRQIFQELALDRSEQAKGLARQHWSKMHTRMNKKGYLHFYANDLECDAALFALGLARPSSRGSYVEYAYPSGLL